MEQLQAGLFLISGLAAASWLTVCTVRARRRGGLRREREEKITPAEDDFDEINCLLQTDLKNKIIERINTVKSDIKARKLQQDKNVSDLLNEQEKEISEKRSEFEIAKEIIEYKYREKIEAIKEEGKTEISEMKESLKSLRIILSSSTSSSITETMINTKSELECPVCLEEMRPPRRIWQCSDGHAICDFCRRKPTITSCPTCRKYIVGRSTIAEKLARSVFGGDPNSEERKITLTGYREVTKEEES